MSEDPVQLAGDGSNFYQWRRLIHAYARTHSMYEALVLGVEVADPGPLSSWPKEKAKSDAPPATEMSEAEKTQQERKRERDHAAAVLARKKYLQEEASIMVLISQTLQENKELLGRVEKLPNVNMWYRTIHEHCRPTTSDAKAAVWSAFVGIQIEHFPSAEAFLDRYTELSTRLNELGLRVSNEQSFFHFHSVVKSAYPEFARHMIDKLLLPQMQYTPKFDELRRRFLGMAVARPQNSDSGCLPNE